MMIVLLLSMCLQVNIMKGGCTAAARCGLPLLALQLALGAAGCRTVAAAGGSWRVEERSGAPLSVPEAIAAAAALERRHVHAHGDTDHAHGDGCMTPVQTADAYLARHAHRHAPTAGSELELELEAGRSGPAAARRALRGSTSSTTTGVTNTGSLSVPITACGTTLCDNPALAAAYKAKLRSGDKAFVKTIRYRVINVANDDGKHATVSAKQIKDQHDDLQKGFANASIRSVLGRPAWRGSQRDYIRVCCSC